MDMVSMKNTKGASNEEAPLSPDEEEYPYGLRLTINDEKVAMLGLSNCKVGDDVMVMAKAKVVGKSEYENEERNNKNVDIQITDMSVTKPSSVTERSTKLYG